MYRDYLKFIGFFTLMSSKGFGAEEGMPQLNPEYWISQVFWLILIFGILYIVLWRKILPKINENLENRKSQILSNLDNAQKFKDESEKKKNEYNALIHKAKQEAKRILNETKRKISIDINKKKKEFDINIDTEIKKAEKEIKELKKSSIKEINKIAIATASESVKKILGSEPNNSSVSAIVENISKKEIEKYI